MAEASVPDDSKWQIDDCPSQVASDQQARTSRNYSKIKVHSKHHHHHHHRQHKNSETRTCSSKSSREKSIADVPDTAHAKNIHAQEMKTQSHQDRKEPNQEENAKNYLMVKPDCAYESAVHKFSYLFAEKMSDNCSMSNLDDQEEKASEEQASTPHKAQHEIPDPCDQTVLKPGPDNEAEKNSQISATNKTLKTDDNFVKHLDVGTIERDSKSRYPNRSNNAKHPNAEQSDKKIFHEDVDMVGNDKTGDPNTEDEASTSYSVPKDSWNLIRIAIAKKKLKSHPQSNFFLDNKTGGTPSAPSAPSAPPSPSSLSLPKLPHTSLWDAFGSDIKFLTALLKAKRDLRPAEVTRGATNLLSDNIDAAQRDRKKERDRKQSLTPEIDSWQSSIPYIPTGPTNVDKIQPAVKDLNKIACVPQAAEQTSSAPPPPGPPPSLWDSMGTDIKFLVSILKAKRNLRPVKETASGENVLPGKEDIRGPREGNVQDTPNLPPPPPPLTDFEPMSWKLLGKNLKFVNALLKAKANLRPVRPLEVVIDQKDASSNSEVKDKHVPEIQIIPPIAADDILLTQIDSELKGKDIENKIGSSHHFTKNGRYLYELYKHDQLTDLVVEVGQYTFNTHAAVMSCHSQYVDSLVKKNTVHRIKLDTEVSPASLQVVLQYMYTGDLEINGDNASEVLECSATLEIPEIASRCHTLLNEMAPEDLLQVVQMALQGGVKEATLSKQWEKISSNFCNIVESTKFLNMDVNTVCALVSRDDISVEREMDVAQAVFRWLSYTDERQQHAQRAISHVRFPLMSSQEIVTILSKFKTILVNAPLKQAILESLWYVTSIEQNIDFHVEESDMPKPRTGILQTKESDIPIRKSSSCNRKVSMNNLKIETDDKGVPRISATDLQTLYGTTSSTETDQQTDEKDPPEEDKVITPPCIFLVGGYGADPDKGAQEGRWVEHYDVKEDRWQPFAMIPEPRNKHAVALLDGQIYVLGGSSSSPMSEQTPTNIVFRLNISTGVWEKLRPMKSVRMYHVAAVMGGKIYAIGGQSKDDQILPSAEYYNPNKDIWFKACPPRYSRMAAAATVFDNKIYTAGGYGYESSKKHKSTHREVLNTVEYYDPKAKSWTLVSPLPYPKTNSRLAVLGQSLYSFGGLCPSGHSPINTFEHAMFVDLYDNKNDSWTSVTTLQTPRCDAGVAVLDSQLYIMGGMDLKDISGVDTVERYDSKTGEWTTMSPLPSIRSGPQCVSYCTD